MKIYIAKIFCLLTVLLLSSNVVLSSIPVDRIFQVKSLNKSQSDELVFLPGAPLGSQLSFLAEKDPFEDFEFLADLPDAPLSISFKAEFQPEVIFTDFKAYCFSSLKIPRWLWIRHIII